MKKVCRILVVEDQADIAELLAEFLTDEGYRIETARDGETMRARIADEDFDVVVLDLTLPGESGWTLADAASEQGIGLILVTGARDQEEALEASGHRYLLKPFRLAELAAAVEDVLIARHSTCVKDEAKHASA